MSNTLDLSATLNNAGFTNLTKISDTLQGNLYKALKTSTNENIVIKITNKHLHENSIAIINNTKYTIKENILLEASILKHLTTQQDAPKSIIKFHNFFQCNTNYYMVMEHGGSDIFDFIVKAHQLILTEHITISEWHKVVKVIFKQMIESIEFIHSKHICHFDLSLENYLINDVNIQCNKNLKTTQSKIQFMSNEIQIKLIDFGLASVFTKSNYKSNKWCGKTDYKSPEVAAKMKLFLSDKNDIWCLGIMLFIMIIGCKPWKKAIKSDDIFQLIMSGNINMVLNAWNKLQYVNKDLIDLMNGFFQYEENRISLDEVKQHSWLRY